jgi:hypothetical protein
METAMDRSPQGRLSPNEESTLRMIARGKTEMKHLRPQDMSRLTNFGLAETVDGRIKLTKLGIERMALADRGVRPGNSAADLQ